MFLAKVVYFDKDRLYDEEGLPKGGHSGTHTRNVLHILRNEPQYPPYDLRKWFIENEPTAPAEQAHTNHTAAVKNRQREKYCNPCLYERCTYHMYIW